MDRHVTVLAALHIAYGVLGVLIATVVFIAVVGGGMISKDADAIAVTSVVGTTVAIFLTLVFAPGVVGGIYLLKRQSWARILLIVVGALNLFIVPIGTALGIYTIWVLTNVEVTKEFSPSTQP